MAGGKFSGIRAAIEEAKHEQRKPAPGRTERVPAQVPPTGKRRAPGKRSDPAWRQHTVMLKRETHLEATDILRRQENGQDISELLQRLLEQWVKHYRNP